MKKNIAVITPGGDASGINACIRSIVRCGIYKGYRIFGIERGYEGLLNEEIIPLDLRSVSNIIQYGGTILKSTRCKIIRTPEGVRKASTILKKHNINWLIIIGGDGSFTAGGKISRISGIPVTGIPGTIDNDVYGTDETIGFDTAIDVCIDAIDRIRDTARSFERIFVVEVMGREHGFLALNVALAAGAEFVIIPEIRQNLDDICKKIEYEKKSGKTSIIIIFAEGAGNPYRFAEKLKNKTGMDVKVSSLGYIQRGGAPSARSRILACKFGEYAIKLIDKNIKNCVVGIKSGMMISIPLREVISKQKKIDKDIYKLVMKLAI